MNASLPPANPITTASPCCTQRSTMLRKRRVPSQLDVRAVALVIVLGMTLLKPREAGQ